MGIDLSVGLSPKDEHGVWVTWLAKLLADPAQCKLPAWVQTRFNVARDDTFTGNWAAKHGALIEKAKARLEHAQRPCVIEQDVSVISRTGLKILGSIDVWAPEHDGKPAVVIDAKTGKHKPAHRLQVNLYQLMTGANERFGCTRPPSGMLMYPESEIWINASEASQDLAKRTGATMDALASSRPPIPTPSKHNCRFCSIGHLCPDRYGQDPPAPPVMELF
jgi:CRISPR/Cas system-associated exonuclease Cas4 (RecB family)